jgi:hypothetical protein
VTAWVVTYRIQGVALRPAREVCPVNRVAVNRVAIDRVAIDRVAIDRVAVYRIGAPLRSHP